MDFQTFWAILTNAAGNIIAAAVIGMVAAIGGVLLGRRHAQIAFVERCASPVEEYLKASLRYQEEVGAFASIWGPDVPLDFELDRRLTKAANDGILSHHLGALGTEARHAANLADPKLLRLVEESEAESVRIMQTCNWTLPGQSVAPILAQIRKAQESNRRVAARLRSLRR